MMAAAYISLFFRHLSPVIKELNAVHIGFIKEFGGRLSFIYTQSKVLSALIHYSFISLIYYERAIVL